MPKPKSNQPVCRRCHAFLPTRTVSASRDHLVANIAQDRLFSQDMLIDIGLANHPSATSPIINRLIRSKQIVAADKLRFGKGRPTEVFTAYPEDFTDRFVDRFALSDFLSPWLDYFGGQRLHLGDGATYFGVVSAHFIIPHVFCAPGNNYLPDELLDIYLYDRHVYWVWLTDFDSDDIVQDFLDRLHPFATLTIFVVPERTAYWTRRLRSIVPYEPTHYGISEHDGGMNDIYDINGRPISLEGLFNSDTIYSFEDSSLKYCQECRDLRNQPGHCSHHHSDCSFDHPMLNANLCEPDEHFQASWRSAMVSSAYIEGHGHDVQAYIAHHEPALLQKYGQTEWDDAIEEAAIYKEIQQTKGGPIR